MADYDVFDMMSREGPVSTYLKMSVMFLVMIT